MGRPPCVGYRLPLTRPCPVIIVIPSPSNRPAEWPRGRSVAWLLTWSLFVLETISDSHEKSIITLSARRLYERKREKESWPASPLFADDTMYIQPQNYVRWGVPGLPAAAAAAAAVALIVQRQQISKIKSDIASGCGSSFLSCPISFRPGPTPVERAAEILNSFLLVLCRPRSLGNTRQQFLISKTIVIIDSRASHKWRMSASVG